MKVYVLITVIIGINIGLYRCLVVHKKQNILMLFLLHIFFKKIITDKIELTT